MNRRKVLKYILSIPVLSLSGISKVYPNQQESFVYNKNGVDFDIKHIKDKRWDVILRAFDYTINKNPNAKKIKIEVY